VFAGRPVEAGAEVEGVGVHHGGIAGLDAPVVGDAGFGVERRFEHPVYRLRRRRHDLDGQHHLGRREPGRIVCRGRRVHHHHVRDQRPLPVDAHLDGLRDVQFRRTVHVEASHQKAGHGLVGLVRGGWHVEHSVDEFATTPVLGHGVEVVRGPAVRRRELQRCGHGSRSSIRQVFDSRTPRAMPFHVNGRPGIAEH